MSSKNRSETDSKPGAIYPDPRCKDCLLKLSEDVTRMVGERAIAHRRHIQSETGRILSHGEAQGWASPECANEILRVIRGVSGINDPYETVKTEEMALAKPVFEKARKQASHDLRGLVNLAVLGNNLDFFRSAKDAMAGVLLEMGSDPDYFCDDVDRLERFLANKPGLVLYLTDNAGEAFFDMPLFKYLESVVGRVVLVVKGGPGMNDLTGAEVASSAIGGMFGDVMDTGTDGAGIDWRHVSKEFADMVERADLIISKGMANFETLIFRRLPTPVFFLFKVKCGAIADYLNAPMDSTMALWKE